MCVLIYTMMECFKHYTLLEVLYVNLHHMNVGDIFFSFCLFTQYFCIVTLCNNEHVDAHVGLFLTWRRKVLVWKETLILCT